MDPLEIVLDCNELIFQHFTVEEVLEFSMTSKKWYNAIGKSSAAMKKLWVNVGDRFNEPEKEDLRAFRASERDYKNFKISEIENGLQILIFPKRKWRKGQIDIQSYTTFKDYAYLLKVFSDTIVELNIFDMDIGFEKSDTAAMNFPQLRRLQVGYVTSVALNPFLRTQQHLEMLILNNITDNNVTRDGTVQQLMTIFLIYQHQLTHLSMSSDAFVKVFATQISFDFNLKYLLVEYSGNCEFLLSNFKSFLTDQKNLSWITLCEWTCEKTVAKIFNHEHIERISFDYFDGDSKKFDSSNLILNQNHKIRRIDFEWESLTLDCIKPVLMQCPNATVFYFFHVNQELLEYLMSNFNNLKTLQYCSIFEKFNYFYSNFYLKNAHLNSRIEIVEDKFIKLNI